MRTLHWTLKVASEGVIAGTYIGCPTWTVGTNPSIPFKVMPTTTGGKSPGVLGVVSDDDGFDGVALGVVSDDDGFDGVAPGVFVVGLSSAFLVESLCFSEELSSEFVTGLSTFSESTPTTLSDFCTMWPGFANATLLTPMIIPATIKAVFLLHPGRILRINFLKRRGIDVLTIYTA